MKYLNCKPRLIASAIAAMICCATRVSAQTAGDASLPPPAVGVVAQAQTIEIKGQALRNAASPYSSTALDEQQVRDAAASQPEQLLRQVPGVEVRGYHLGGVVNVITIRGFSGGAHGGDLGMIIDGIPLNEAMSHADGYADLNVIVPLEIGRFEVFRGPVSALYGNFNRGGLIAIDSRRGGRYAEVDASVASFGTADVQGALGTRLGAGQFNGAAQLYRTGDYRPNSDFTRGTLSGRWTLALAPGSDLSFSGRAHKGDWKSASYLLKTQFDGGDPYGKDSHVNNDGGSKNFYTGRVDYNLLLSERLKLLSFAYATDQDYSRFFTRPLNNTTWSQREETYKRKVGGVGFSINGSKGSSGLPLDWVAGAELYRESTDYLFFEGTQGRLRTSAASYDRRYTFNSASAFTELSLSAVPWLQPTLGLRFDRFTGDCTRQAAETGSDPCATLNTATRTTPKLGLRSTVAPGLDLRTSLAEGFALPPGVAKYAAGGSGLKTTVLRQIEVGVAYKVGGFRGDLATYRITSSNEVATVSPGVYVNFGSTRRKGVEAALTWMPLADAELALVANTADAMIVENLNPALIGKQVTGVPKTSVSVRAAFRPAAGWGGSAELRHLTDSAVDAANTLFYGAFTTLDVGLQYQGLWGSTRYRGYLRIANATNRQYASNAFVIGGQTLVAPDAPRNFQLGIQTDF